MVTATSDPAATPPRQNQDDATRKGGDLLAALVWLSGHFGRARSAEALQAGLPLKPGKPMSPQIFCQAAARAGLKARAVKRAISDIPGEVMPVVLALKDGTALVLKEITSGGELKLLQFPGAREFFSKPENLAKTYSGHAFFVHPEGYGSESAESERHWFWSTVLDSKGLYTQVLIASFMINIFALAAPLFIMNVYNRVLPNQAIETGWVLGIGALSIFVFDFLVKTLRGYFIDLGGRKADVLMGQRLYDQILDARLSALHRKPVGALANSLREFDTIRDFFTSATMTGLIDFPFSALFLFVVFLISPPIGALLLVIYIAVMVSGIAVQWPVKRAVKKAMGSAEARHSLLVETLGAIEMIRGIGGEGRLRALYAEYTGLAAEAGQTSRFYSGLSVNISGFFQQASSVGAILIGMYLVKDGDLTAGALIAAILLAGRAIAPVGQVAALINRYHQAKAAYRSLDQIMKMPVERPLDRNFLYRPALRGGFQFRDVTFSYVRDIPALSRISFAIRPGEKVGIVGRIGSGKSTIIKLMMDFYQPDEGSVLIDGTDLRQVDPADLRRNVAYFGQDTVLFSGSVRANIALGKPDATDQEILQAATIAGVHDFIRHHPMGYDAPVGERGTGFSGGQRQAIALARTFLTGAQALVCDEPTNAMDWAAEEQFMKNLEGYIKDKTFILVTHKQSLLRLVDRLILLDQGKVLMDGPREAVLAALTTGKLIVPAAGKGG